MPNLERDQRKLLASRFISSAGDQLFYIAVVSHLYAATGSAVASISFFVVKAVVHAVGLTMYRDALWTNHRQVVIWSDFCRVVLVLALVPALADTSVWMILVLVAALEAVQVVYSPSRLCLTNQYVDGDRSRTNLKDQAASTLALAIGLAAGGILSSLVSSTAAIVIDAATFLTSAILVLALKQAPHTLAAFNHPLSKSVTPLRWVRSLQQSLARSLVTYYLFAQVPVIAFNVALGVKVLSTPDGSALAFGLIEGAMGVGLFVGSALSFKVPEQYRLPVLCTSSILQALLFSTTAMTDSLTMLGLILCLSGVMNMLAAATHRTLVAQSFARSGGLSMAWLIYRSGSAVLGGALGMVIAALSDFGSVFAGQIAISACCFVGSLLSATALWKTSRLGHPGL